MVHSLAARPGRASGACRGRPLEPGKRRTRASHDVYMLPDKNEHFNCGKLLQLCSPEPVAKGPCDMLAPSARSKILAPICPGKPHIDRRDERV